jgi:PBP1b-binding outer membrane lipoprotein LpoB
MKKLSFVAIALLFVSIVLLSSCSKQEDIVDNAEREQTFTGQRFSVKYPGFYTLGKSYE